MADINNTSVGSKLTEKPVRVVNLDKYSKAILSVIAVCLILITANIYFEPKDANAYDTVQDVNLKTINGFTISSGYLPVDLQRIEGSSSKNLKIDIQSVNGRSVFGDKLPVDIQGINGQFFIGSDLPVKVR